MLLEGAVADLLRNDGRLIVQPQELAIRFCFIQLPSVNHLQSRHNPDMVKHYSAKAWLQVCSHVYVTMCVQQLITGLTHT